MVSLKKLTEALGFRFFALMALLIATVGLFEAESRYEVVGPQMLDNSTFEDGLKGWSVRIKGSSVKILSGVVTIHNSKPKHSFSVRQTVPIPSGARSLILSADFGTEAVVPGNKPWQLARIHVVGRTAEKKMLWGTSHVLVSETGTNNLDNYKRIFPVSGDAVDVQVAAIFLKATGTMRAGNFNLVPLAVRVDFQILTYFFIILWCSTLMWAYAPLIQIVVAGKNKLFLVAITMTILVGVLIPSDVSQIVMAAIKSSPDKVASEILLYWNYLLNAGHFAFFLFLGLASRLAFHSIKISIQFAQLSLFAAITEVLQYFAIGRSPSFVDWWVDVSGVALAFVLYWAVRGNSANSISE